MKGNEAAVAEIPQETPQGTANGEVWSEQRIQQEGAHIVTGAEAHLRQEAEYQDWLAAKEQAESERAESYKQLSSFVEEQVPPGRVHTPEGDALTMFTKNIKAEAKVKTMEADQRAQQERGQAATNAQIQALEAARRELEAQQVASVMSHNRYGPESRYAGVETGLYQMLPRMVGGEQAMMKINQASNRRPQPWEQGGSLDLSGKPDNLTQDQIAAYALSAVAEQLSAERKKARSRKATINQSEV